VPRAAIALASLPRGGDAIVELDLATLRGLPEALASRARRVVVRSAEELERALALPHALIEIPLERATEAVALRAAAAAPHRTLLTLPGRALLSEVVDREPSPGALAGAAATARSEGLPLCVAPSSSRPRTVLDATSLCRDGSLDLLPWAEAYVREGYRTWSLRCSACVDRARCPGEHVNRVRAHGFGWMRPRASGME
jgi:hypothetical protein